MNTAAPEALSHVDPEANRIGMWLFLLTEVLLFGTLFIFYAAYFRAHPADYHLAAGRLDRWVGAFNTVVLLTSSLTMALAIHAVRHGARESGLRFLLATVSLGLLFLVVKGFEWSHKFEVGIYLNSDVLLALPQGQILFYGLYFTMTGLHALHVLIGMGVILFVFARVRARRETPSLVENAGLYWHLVDLVWIYLFPLFYLIGR